MTEQTLTGSCLCGALQYSVTGEPSRFYHCHCSRCRKSSGTGHASNLFIDNASLNWTGDTDLISSYKLPDAKRFTRTFCSRCGGPVPAELPDYNMAFVPAGTLDDEPALKPQARLFQDSRTTWSCSDEEIPCFETYPG